MKIEKGDNIKVEYTGTFENGEVFDASAKHGKPLEFTAGQQQVVPGFDNAVLGMKKGEEKKITLKPTEAYGERQEQAIQKVPANKFPKEAKKGMQIGIPLPNGQQYPATIIDMNDKEVTIDMNHPLAGKTLKFDIKIVDIKK